MVSWAFAPIAEKSDRLVVAGSENTGGDIGAFGLSLVVILESALREVDAGALPPGGSGAGVISTS